MVNSGSIKFYIIGLGSMGRRRIRNLLFLKVPKENIGGFDTDARRCRAAAKEYDIKTFDNFQDGIERHSPTALIISTPPDKHQPYFMWAARHKMHFFVEVATTNKGYGQLMPMIDGKFVAAPSCTFRYLSAVKIINGILAQKTIGKIFAFEHYLGQYLPDWHPYEDYRRVYFAQKNTGGCREMLPYELNWLSYILKSHVKDIKGVHKKISALPISADDLYAAIIRMSNGIIGSMAIDLLNQVPRRTLTLIGDSGSLEWNWLARTIVITTKIKRKILRLSKEKAIGHYHTVEDAYQDEIKDFILAIQGDKKFPYTFQEDNQILEVLNKFLKP